MSSLSVSMCPRPFLVMCFDCFYETRNRWIIQYDRVIESWDNLIDAGSLESICRRCFNFFFFFFSYALPRFRPQNYNVDFLLLFLWSHDSWLNQYSTWWWTFRCDFEDRDDAQFICSDATRRQFISSWIGIITCIEFYHLWLIYSYSDHDRASVVGLLRKKGFCLLVTLLLFKVFFFPPILL